MMEFTSHLSLLAVLFSSSASKWEAQFNKVLRSSGVARKLDMWLVGSSEMKSKMLLRRSKG